MNWKSAIKTIIVGYAIMFLLGSVFIGFGLETYMPYAMVILNAIVVYILALNMYFQPVESLKPINDGIQLGIAWIVISAILDIGLLVYAFNAGNWSVMTSWNMLVGYAETLLIPIAIGLMGDQARK